MVLSIIAAVFTVSIIAVAAIGIVESPDNYSYRIYTNDGYNYNYNSYHKTYSYDKGKVSCIWWRFPYHCIIACADLSSAYRL